jgi:hypothetical protein
LCFSCFCPPPAERTPRSNGVELTGFCSQIGFPTLHLPGTSAIGERCRLLLPALPPPHKCRPRFPVCPPTRHRESTRPIALPHPPAKGSLSHYPESAPFARKTVCDPPTSPHASQPVTTPPLPPCCPLLLQCRLLLFSLPPASLSSSRFTSKSRSHLQHFPGNDDYITFVGPRRLHVFGYRDSIRTFYHIRRISLPPTGGGVVLTSRYLCTACCEPETGQAVTLCHPCECYARYLITRRVILPPSVIVSGGGQNSCHVDTDTRRGLWSRPVHTCTRVTHERLPVRQREHYLKFRLKIFIILFWF